MYGLYNDVHLHDKDIHVRQVVVHQRRSESRMYSLSLRTTDNSYAAFR